jgi:hypothetical protein
VGIAVASFLVSAAIPQRPAFSFLSGFLGVFLLWEVLAWWIDNKNNGILSQKVSVLFGMGGSSVLLIVITSIIGALVAGFGALAGSYQRRLIYPVPRAETLNACHMKVNTLSIRHEDIFLFLSFIFLYHGAHAVKVSGVITDDKGISYHSPLFLSRAVRWEPRVMTGKIFLDLPAGSYTIVCQYVGYGRQEKIVKLVSESITLDFQLSIQRTNLKEVVIKPGGEDPAYEIIRQAIKKKIL